MFELPEPISATYKFSKLIAKDNVQEEISVYLEINFITNTFHVLDYKKRPQFVFRDSNYAWRWRHIAELIQQATTAGVILTQSSNETKE